MQFRDLQQQYIKLQPQIDAAIAEVLNSSNFISGRQVTNLEERLSDYVGTRHCLTCANGTDALSMVLMAWGIKKGDAVFVPDFTFFSSGEVVCFEGATPVFVDVNPNTFNMDSECLEERIREVIDGGRLKPRAIITVDLFGLPADYWRLKLVAETYGLKILEDSAQGFGGMVRNQRACSFGEAATTSFFPAKPLGCYGDGGAVFTNDDELAEYIKSIRIHGKGKHKYDNVRIGWNSRLDTIQAAVLDVKFDAFTKYELNNINQVACYYSDRLAGIVQIPHIPEGFYSSWAQYTIRLDSKSKRDGLYEHLKKNNIPSNIYYPIPMHKQKAFTGLLDDKQFPITENLCNTVLSLPIHPYMKKKDIELVVNCVADWTRRL